MLFELGLVAPYGIQPGVQLGLVQPLGEHLFVRPQLGVYTRPGRHTTGMLDVELGVQGRRLGASVGVAYQAEWRIEGATIGLDGSRSTTRGLHHHVLPTLNTDVAWDRERVDPYVRLSVGRQWPVGRMFAGLEVGVRL